MQTRGSKSPVDIWAAKPGQLLFVQVKGGAKSISGEQWNALFEIACKAGAIPVVADKPLRRGGWRLRRVTGRHVPHSREWSWLPFLTDEVAP